MPQASPRKNASPARRIPRLISVASVLLIVLAIVTLATPWYLPGSDVGHLLDVLEGGGGSSWRAAANLAAALADPHNDAQRRAPATAQRLIALARRELIAPRRRASGAPASLSVPAAGRAGNAGDVGVAHRSGGQRRPGGPNRRPPGGHGVDRRAGGPTPQRHRRPAAPAGKHAAGNIAGRRSAAPRHGRFRAGRAGRPASHAQAQGIAGRSSARRPRQCRPRADPPR